ncbi:TIR domain-containing protein [Rhizobium mongolense]|uniref:Nucleotide-binding protein n=2 Tax=Rhizobium mongolense TaxID=57676 RepID=A0ABR6IW78_9HYPH|nr:nucleotide-binding protein [Rhizobium mongolense]MBB4232177.1 putative nucleotide-binding protein [Rhizobium mongolense]TVZ63103.1 putative nucleotide-binding protein with TIR-like domain [Rhizobium mongolense USDA 1844]
MYNLLVVGSEGYWDETTEKTLGFDRVLSYTSVRLKSHFLPLSDKTVKDICGLPTLFAYEFAKRLPKNKEDWTAPALVGKILSVKEQKQEVLITFEIDRTIKPISVEDILRVAGELDIDLPGGESYRTHWAIKDVDLIDVLRREDILKSETSDKVEDQLRTIATEIDKPEGERQKVFIVHGHSDSIRNDIARWLNKIGFDELLLDEQPNEGLTIIQKLERFAAQAAFAVVLMSPDDVGGKVGEQHSFRARQNVIFELGYLFAKLGGAKVAALAEGKVELPTDLGGVFFIPYDTAGGWKILLAKELKAAGLKFDLIAGI